MKFRVKMTLCMLGLLSVLFGIGGSLLISTSFRASLERERASAYNAYQMVLGTLQIVNRVELPSDYGDISRTLEQLSEQNSGVWVAMRLYTKDQSVYEYGEPISVLPAELAKPGQCLIRYLPDGDDLVLSGALEVGGKTIYLDMVRDVSPLFETRRMQEQIYQRIFLLLTALCAALSYSISRVLTEPLVSLSKTSRAIASGQLSSRVRIRSEDEIGRVSRDFNDMAEALATNIVQLQESVERQERFLGSFAHEIKTPMTSIIGYADLIRGQTLSQDEQTEAANYIFAEGRRLENLSKKLLDLLVLKQGDPAFVPVRPAALIEGLAAHLGPIYESQGITLACECEPGVCRMDPDLVKSLLVNLWDNARKAMDGKGGSITVRSEMLSDGCRISVMDTGRGIPPEALEHLTEAFYRVDKSRARAQGGVGLGLALCQEIARVHGGGLRFDSRQGEGATVTVVLRGGAA